MISELAMRYARALYMAASEQGQADRVGAELKEVSRAIFSDDSIRAFFCSPTVAAAEKQKALGGSLSARLHEVTKNALYVLIDSGRFVNLPELISALELVGDQARGVTRGQVRSSSPLNSEQKSKIENTVNKALDKKVVLAFQEETNLLGGTTAQVGGWSFDDSLASHLKRMSEELNRRSH